MQIDRKDRSSDRSIHRSIDPQMDGQVDRDMDRWIRLDSVRLDRIDSNGMG